MDDDHYLCGIDPFVHPLRVLHIARPSNGTIDRYVRDVCDWQAARGWELHTATPGSLDIHDVKSRSWPAGPRFVGSLPAEIRALSKIVRSVSPDAVVLHETKAGMMGRIAVRGSIPTVFVPNPWSFTAHRGLARVAAVLCERLAARWTNAVVALTETDAEVARRYRIGAPMFVASHDGEDSSFYRLSCAIARAYAFGRPARAPRIPSLELPSAHRP